MIATVRSRRPSSGVCGPLQAPKAIRCCFSHLPSPSSTCALQIDSVCPFLASQLFVSSRLVTLVLERSPPSRPCRSMSKWLLQKTHPRLRHSMHHRSSFLRSILACLCSVLVLFLVKVLRIKDFAVVLLDDAPLASEVAGNGQNGNEERDCVARQEDESSLEMREMLRSWIQGLNIAL